jgi:hypothetical protein
LLGCRFRDGSLGLRMPARNNSLTAAGCTTAPARLKRPNGS